MIFRRFGGRTLVCLLVLSSASVLAHADQPVASGGADAGSADAASKAKPPSKTECAPTCPPITVPGSRYNAATRYEHSLPEVNGTTITVTKKTSVVDLDHLPTVIDNNQRELFDQLPGIVITPGHDGTGAR